MGLPHRKHDVENVGSKDLVIEALTSEDESPRFRHTGGRLSGQTLGSFSECSVEVNFSPARFKQESGILLIPSNDFDFGNLLVSLSGRLCLHFTVEPPNQPLIRPVRYTTPNFAWTSKDLSKAMNSNMRTFKTLVQMQKPQGSGSIQIALPEGECLETGLSFPGDLEALSSGGY